MTQITQVKTKEKLDRGNTRSRSWCFTLNNYTQLEINNIITQFTPAFLYMFQEEIGKNKTPHLQGVVKWKYATSFQKMKKINKRFHIEKCRDIKASVLYCSKKETRSGKQWSQRCEKYIDLTLQEKHENFINWLDGYKNRIIIEMRKKINDF